MVTSEFWKGKKVLITGHTGFKGSWLALWLQSMGASIVGYSLSAPTTPNLYTVARIHEGIHSVTGDVRDFESLNCTIFRYKPEIVIHMAAQSLVRHSYADPVTTYMTNVIGTLNLLESVRQFGGTRVVIIVTSDKCYENRERSYGYSEDDSLGGRDPYSSSKGCAELVTAAYRQSYFSVKGCQRNNVAVASVRAGNVIGGGDWGVDRLIPDIMKSFLAGDTVTIRNPHAVRPWQYVLEPLRGYLCLCERLWEEGPEYAAPWNFGPRAKDERPVHEIVGHLSNLWGSGQKWRIDGGDHPHEAQCLKLDSSKANAVLGWSTVLDLDSALEWTAKWYRAYGRGEDMRQYSEREIGRYLSLFRKKSGYEFHSM